MQQQIDGIKTLIAQNQINEALLVLLKLSAGKLDIENTILSLRGEYNDLLLQINRGTLKVSDVELRKNQIRIRALEVSDLLFHLKLDHSISYSNTDIIIKEKKLNSIKVLMWLTGVLTVFGVICHVASNHLERDSIGRELSDIFALIFLFFAVCSFIGLIRTLVTHRS